MTIKIEDQVKWAKDTLAMLETSSAKLVREMRMKPAEAREGLEKQQAIIRTLQYIADKKGSQVALFDDAD